MSGFVYVPTSAAWTTAHIDERLLVVVKPAELLSVPGKSEDKQDCLIHRVQTRHPEALLVHRLDLATSGLMVFARDRQAQGALGTAFQKRQIVKRYQAVVHGRLMPNAGRVDQPLRCDWDRRPRQVVDRSGGKRSLTDWRVVQRSDDRTYVSLVPHTGRTHQLRVHLEWLGHPILGDRIYAPPGSTETHKRLHLHASVLILPHPDGGPLRVQSAPPWRLPNERSPNPSAGPE